jgi:hypothetical protein
VQGWLVRALSLVFDILFFSCLAILLAACLKGEFLLLWMSFALAGIIPQALFLRRFGVNEPWRSAMPETKVCPACERAIATDAKYCQFCLTAVDEQPESTEQVAIAKDNEETELAQTRRWQATTNVD